MMHRPSDCPHFMPDAAPCDVESDAAPDDICAWVGRGRPRLAPSRMRV
jgi:hypothetical protein